MNKPRIPAHRFTEHSLHYSGSNARQALPNSNVTAAREQAMNDIYNLANTNGVPVDYVVTKILQNSRGELQSYVQSKGETPLSDPTALALQAVLLRAQDVGSVANTLDISDEDALKTIENNLQEDIDSNSPDAANSPSIPVQAALACAMQFLSEQSAANGGPATMSGATAMIQNGASKIRKLRAAAAANNDDITDFSDLIDTDPTIVSDPNSDAAVNMTAAPASVSSSLAAIPGGSVDTSSLASLSPAAAFPTISTTASNLPQASPQTTSGGVFNSIVSALGSISNIATMASSTATTIGKAVSGAGSNSIQTYVQNNSSTITMIVIIIVIIIVASIMSRGK